MKRRIFAHERTDDGPSRSLAAEFWMSDGELKFNYMDEDVRFMFDEEGITTKGGRKVVFPADGKVFFDALPAALSRTTMLSVVNVPSSVLDV